MLCCVAISAILVVAIGSRAFTQAPQKPTPEHEHLKLLVGNWDATIKAGGMESKGTMTYKEQQGGLWLISHFEGDFGGMKFEGDGLDGYSPAKKKYVGVWTDSMSAEPMVLEGTLDKEKQQMVMTGTGTGPDGMPIKFKSVTSRKDKDNIDFTLYMVDNDGKENEMISIAYKRKK
jgi:hypothetical protein